MLTLPMLWMLEGQLGPAGTGSWGTRVTARGMHHGDSFFLLRTPPASILPVWETPVHFKGSTFPLL